MFDLVFEVQLKSTFFIFWFLYLYGTNSVYTPISFKGEGITKKTIQETEEERKKKNKIQFILPDLFS